MAIPVKVLFEKKSLNEIGQLGRTALGMGTGMALGGAAMGGTAMHLNHRALQQYIKFNNLNPADPDDAAKIAEFKKSLRDRVAGAALGGVAAGGALGYAASNPAHRKS